MTTPVMMIVMIMIRRKIRTRNNTGVIMTVRRMTVTVPVRVSPVTLAVPVALMVMKNTMFLTRQQQEDNGHWEKVICNNQLLKHPRL